jgi:glycerophosphoryl diester phosphodiesterase
MVNFFKEPTNIFSTGGGEPALLQDTIRNIQNAIVIGADVIRTNTGITADRKIVVYSNDVFNHGDLAKSGIESYKARELRSSFANILHSRAADDTKDDIDGVFPDMDEVLAAFPGIRFNLNCTDKSPALMPMLKETIERHDARGRILVSSVSGYNTRWIREMMPEVPVTFSFYGMIGFYGLFKSGLIFATRKFAAQALVIPEKIGASFFANSGLIEQAKKRGIRVYVNPVDTEQLARRVKEAGADGIITNDVKAVKRAYTD